jgi:hypothetical protein
MRGREKREREREREISETHIVSCNKERKMLHILG